jgi:flagellar basal-body rod protein FlgG
MRALNIAATGMAAQNMRVEVISHNLANMSTTAYNARRAEFSDLHYQQVARERSTRRRLVPPAGVQPGSACVRPPCRSGGGYAAEKRLARPRHRPGGAISIDAAERRPMRDGALKRDGDGDRDVTFSSPDITIPEDAREISIALRRVYAYFDGRPTLLLGQFTLTSFSNERAWRRWAEPLPETEASGPPQQRAGGQPRHRQPRLSGTRRRRSARDPGLIEPATTELNAKVITAMTKCWQPRCES